MFTSIYYFVEFLTHLAVIAYVLYTFGAFTIPKPKSDVPASFSDTLKQTQSIIGTAASFAQQLRNASAPSIPAGNAPANPPK